jgi:fucose permease
MVALVPPERHGMASALNVFFMGGIGSAVGPFVVGYVSDATGSLHTALTVPVLAQVAAALLFALGARITRARARPLAPRPDS